MQHRCLVCAVALALAACGDNIRPAGDAGGPPDSEVFMLCGNGILEGSEACDDGGDDPDDGCSATCTLECGDGEVTGDETCDGAIDEGDPGACPTADTCTATDACTTAIVSGGDCHVTCEFAVTTALIDGDGCCPEGGDATNDDDCVASCGNAVVETPELCDLGIATGFGACPTVCNDGQNCTIDALVNGGTCDADCTETPITAIGPADTCCPPGGMPGTDVDCAGCGDGSVVPPETCDTMLPGSCPVACDDGVACTVDTLVNAGTCSAACTTSPRAPGPMDGCCPAGSDLGDDPDCPPVCGDGVITAPETCDDSNATGGDGCSAVCRVEPIAFRFSDLDLKDPHAFATVPILGCTDVTNLDLFGNKGVNPTLQDNIQLDDPMDADTLLDLSIANTFVPLAQAAGTMSASDLTFPDCTAPMSTTSCTLPAGSAHIPATANNSAAGTTCLAPVPGTTSGYSPAVVSSIAPMGGTCYLADAGTVTFDLGGIPITLTGAKIAGEWFGNPATEIRDGLISGFMSETVANMTIIPEGTTGIATIDGEPLSSLLRGGVNSCSQPSPATGNKDTVGTPGVVGWMFYLNFTAIKRPYTEL